ncbi:energy-coupling factor transporter ATPase [Desulfofundulus thermosubterraneus]|uniref:energy-coupling factor transporter ATPase n=1 Tax=Desulfofundulus thermosubterraneus TaxID=348840 RepID=UPI000A000626|nr:energy-coupling factor transporter ATPase [Desulfofundulus thermosubterraneus]
MCKAGISIRGLSHIYHLGQPGERIALQDISGDIRQGELLAIIGPNGSGKSTLARHFNAVLLPTRGTVTVNGLSTADPANRWEIRCRVGMVLQNPDNQLVAAVVEEDVAFGPENLGLPPEEVRRRVDRALALAGLGEQRLRPPHLLSGGQKQRLAIAGALAMKPSCLVLDEPTAMLDPAGRREVIQTLLSLNREEGLTIVLVTHFMEEAVLADRVWVLSGGRLVLEGTPAQVFSHREALQKIGLALPGPAELAWRLRAAGWPVPAGILTLNDLVACLADLLSETGWGQQ